MKYAIYTNEFNQTLDQMITPIMLISETGTPIYVNQAFQAIIGYPIDELPDKNNWFEKAYPDPSYRERILKNWHDALITADNNDDNAVHVISSIRCADGVSRWFDVHQHTIASKRVITFLDIDGPMQRNEALAALVEIKEKLLGIIAHDVRNPLSCFKLIAEGHKKEILSEAEVQHLLFKMTAQVEHVFNIINPLLLRISGDRGGFAVQREPIDLGHFFSKYAAYYQERLEKQGGRLVLALPKHATLHYDPVILDTICRNLLDNAIRFTGNNGFVLVSFKRTAGHARLVIRDSGPGMSHEQVERIINNKASRRIASEITDGFGLGLVLAKELLEKYQGRLSIESEPGIGTAFIIEINDHNLN
jgi:PAS domain S-box-containing protein